MADAWHNHEVLGFPEKPSIQIVMDEFAESRFFRLAPHLTAETAAVSITA
jgi:hypothetical protein